MDHMDRTPHRTTAYRNTVLVVDDEPVNRMVLQGVLPDHIRVVSADSGEAALEAAAGDPRPDLILLDVMMPGMDGFDVLTRLRQTPATRDIPVILVTALMDEDSEQRGFALGAADYIHKPIRAAVVNARVQVQLEAKAARDMLDHNNQRLRHKVEHGAQALEKTQLQLLQAEKMASLGQLAAGVAHEINNPVGFVGSNLGTLTTYVGDLLALVDAYERAVSSLPDPTPFAEPAAQRRQLDFVQQMNRRMLAAAPGHAELEGVIESSELAFRMQTSVPQTFDTSDEPQHVRDLYGIDDGTTARFGESCLMARRLVEKGVRFIQLTSAGWDHHNNLRSGLQGRWDAIDRPIAGLLADLKQRDLLKDTLIVWGGEFGRTTADDKGDGDGRGHQAKGFTMWMAGGGVKGGYQHGATDELGTSAVEGKMNMHDLHATILHLLGLDHERLTYRYAGRDFRLTETGGVVAKEIFA